MKLSHMLGTMYFVLKKQCYHIMYLWISLRETNGWWKCWVQQKEKEACKKQSISLLSDYTASVKKLSSTKMINCTSTIGKQS